MSNIVERLRERAAGLDEADRPLSDATIAADEIVRLRLERDGLAERSEAFRTAVIESGALNHVPQSKYFVSLRRLEQALAMVRER